MTTTSKPSLEIQIKNLIKDRSAWEKAVSKTNTMHYGILQKIAILAASTKDGELTALATKFAIRATKKTSKTLIFTKMVFGATTREEEQKASANAKAIENAIIAGTAPIDVAKWLESIGGVEKARKWKLNQATSATTVTSGTTASSAPPKAAASTAEAVSSPVIEAQDEKPLERAKDYLRNAYGPLTVGAEIFHEITLPMIGSGYCAVIFAPTADGNFHPVFATSHNDAVDAVLKQMGRTLAEPENEANSSTSLIIAKPNTDDDDADFDALLDAAAAENPQNDDM